MAMLMDVVAISVVAVVRVDVPRGCKIDRMAMRRSKINARRHASLRACIASGVVKPRVATIFSNAVRN